jgi:hypothetical protein
LSLATDANGVGLPRGLDHRPASADDTYKERGGVPSARARRLLPSMVLHFFEEKKLAHKSRSG